MKKKTKSLKKKVLKHIAKDDKDFRKQIAEDKKLVKELKTKKNDAAKKHGKKKDPKKPSRKKAKIEKVMHEYKSGELHSGSKSGPEVTNPKQAIAIALSESRKVGKKRKRKK